jgi:translation elongation factor EF-1alpha
MKIKTAVLLMFLAIPSVGCDKSPGDSEKATHDFEMTVEKVDELHGIILRGIAVIGTVKSGCIANNDHYTIKRDGKDVLGEIARILKVSEKQDAQSAAKGDVLHLYVPDRKKDDVKPGDIVTGSKTSCQ